MTFAPVRARRVCRLRFVAACLPSAVFGLAVARLSRLLIFGLPQARRWALDCLIRKCSAGCWIARSGSAGKSRDRWVLGVGSPDREIIGLGGGAGPWTGGEARGVSRGCGRGVGGCLAVVWWVCWGDVGKSPLLSYYSPPISGITTENVHNSTGGVPTGLHLTPSFSPPSTHPTHVLSSQGKPRMRPHRRRRCREVVVGAKRQSPCHNAPRSNSAGRILVGKISAPPKFCQRQTFPRSSARARIDPARTISEGI